MSITSPCLAELVIRTRISCSTSRIYFTLSLLFFSSLFLLLSLTFLPFFHERTVIRTQLNCCKMSGRLNVGRVVIHFFLSFFFFFFFYFWFLLSSNRRRFLPVRLCVVRTGLILWRGGAVWNGVNWEDDKEGLKFGRNVGGILRELNWETENFSRNLKKRKIIKNWMT